MGIRCSAFIATSLDGFISRDDGDLDWLDVVSAGVPEGEDCGYGAFMATIDCIVMGRKTFEKVLTFDSWPFELTRVVVLSSTALLIPEALSGKVTILNAPPDMIVEQLAGEGVQHIYVDGGETIRRFLDAGLIDDLTLSIVPMVLGSGRPLFQGVKRDIGLTLVSAKAYDFGFVQTVYSVERNRA